MNTEYKERKVGVRTRRTKPTTTDEPEEVKLIILGVFLTLEIIVLLLLTGNCRSYISVLANAVAMSVLRTLLILFTHLCSICNRLTHRKKKKLIQTGICQLCLRF